MALLRAVVSIGLGGLSVSASAAPVLFYSAAPVPGGDYLGDIKVDGAGNVVFWAPEAQTSGSFWQGDVVITKLSSDGRKLFTKKLG